MAWSSVVAPVYQPEVAAQAIVRAAEHPRRRRYRVGPSTVGTVLGQRSAPRLLGLRLGRTGRNAQVRDAPAPERDNLFAPLDEVRDLGAHGEFDDESREVSLRDELNRRRRTPVLLGPGAVIGAVGYANRGTVRRQGR